MTKRPWQKLKYLDNKKTFRDKIKTFFIIYEGLSMKQITQTFLEGESLTLNKGAGKQPGSLLKILLFRGCFSHILPLQIGYLFFSYGRFWSQLGLSTKEFVSVLETFYIVQPSSHNLLEMLKNNMLYKSVYYGTDPFSELN